MCSVAIRLGDINNAAGSSYVELNKSKVFASVSPPTETKQSSSKFQIELSVRHAFDSSMNFDALRYRLSNIFGSCILKGIYKNIELKIGILILDAGDSLSDCITLAGTLALVDSGIQMNDMAISCTLSLKEDGTLLPFIDSDKSIFVVIKVSSKEVVDLKITGQLEKSVALNSISLSVEYCDELMRRVRTYFQKK